MTGLDDHVRDSAAIRDEQVERLTLDGERELLHTIMGERRPARERRPSRLPRARRALDRARGADASAHPSTRRRLAIALAGVAAVAAFALAGVSLTGGGELRAGPERAWGAQALRVAGAVPRLAIGEPGWQVVRADEFRVDDGELQFAKPGFDGQLTWRPVRWHRGYVEDRAHSSERVGEVQVAGNTAVVYRYKGAVDDYTALWRDGRYSFELRTMAIGEAHLTPQRFTALVASLKLVSVDEWLGSLPASVVLPDDRVETVRTMLRGIPLPDGFDSARLAAGDAVRDRYQLGATVAGGVACVWVERWVAARTAGDAATAQASVDALATARDWPVLREMARSGDYPDVLYEYADAIAGDGTVIGGRELSVAASYGAALGCHDR